MTETTVKKKSTKIKAFFAAIVAFALMLTIIPMASAFADPVKGYPATDNQFTDLKSDEWYMTDGWVPYVYEQGLMKGYAKNGVSTKEFGPENHMDRAQAVTTLYRIAFANDQAALDKTLVVSKYDAKNTTGLSDLAGGEYYTAALNWAMKKGIITGYEGGPDKGKFKPYDHISREELTTMLYRYASNQAGINTSADSSKLKEFPDYKSIQKFAQAGMAWCTQEGIVTGYTSDGKIHPDDEALRGHLAKILTVFDNKVLNNSAQEWVPTDADGNPIPEADKDTITQVGGYWQDAVVPPVTPPVTP